MISLNLTFTNLFLTSLTFFLLYFIYKFYILPLLRIQYYTKQGAKRIFHWKLLAYIDNYRNAAKRGDFYYNYKKVLEKHPKTRVIVENFASRPYLALVDLEMVKEAWKRHEIYQKDPYPFALIMELAGGTTIFAEEAAWKKGRRVISSAFNYEFLKNIVPMIMETTQEKFQELIKEKELKDVNLLEKLAGITGEITARFFFGKRFHGRTIFGVPMTTVVHRQLNMLFMEALSLPYIVFGPRLVKANILKKHKELNKGIVEIRRKCLEMIEETEKSNKKEDNLLGVLLDLRRSGDVQDRLTDDQIVGEFLGLFGAGTDTTSHLVNSAIYFLWKYKEIYEKVKEEVDREFGNMEDLSIEKINKMEYMNAFLKETLRLGGPTTAYFFRAPVKDDNLCGMNIKKGTIVNFHPDLYYSSEEFFPNHKEFRPERWLEGNSHEQNALKAEPYAFIPFSAGPRNCVGQHLAMIEARIIIGLFIKTFKFEFPRDYQLKMVKRFLYEPFDPLMVTLEPLVGKD